MKNKTKAKALTIMFMLMFLSILYFIALAVPSAWKVYGICFGSLGVVYFTLILFKWISIDDAGRGNRNAPCGRHHQA